MNRRVGVFYATREGQTAKIATHVAADLEALGFEADLHNVDTEAEEFDWGGYSAVIVAASVHAGKHESEMVKFVQTHRAELDQLPSAFLSVTLSEAGVERQDVTPEERAKFAAGVQEVLQRFYEQTGWHPLRERPVAGALLYSKYNIFVRWVMKRIAHSVGASTDTSHDHEYTDWVALDRFLSDFTSGLALKAKA